ncbi:hypothetical protein HXX76_011522 [Chlamydomonas incerta]|uniref:EF-hand domain-containing protein n=1 Tax=Chlamydomonas incerta TaxID=51695 RepID=A0A835SNK6_CHLIN|nr:hypothetical protein HXX76_011522 [Chlamydomonas incerta]|eukprot:KAG2428402.1 hypothetical protein HXX76_011522 [Chlamydomonas incerta]
MCQQSILDESLLGCRDCWSAWATSGCAGSSGHLAAAYCVPCVQRYSVPRCCPRGHPLMQTRNEWWLPLREWSSNVVTDEAYRRLRVWDARKEVAAVVQELFQNAAGNLVQLARVHGILRSLDKNGDGTVSWSEFLATSTGPSVEMIRGLFDCMDADGNGSLNYQEVAGFMLAMQGTQFLCDRCNSYLFDKTIYGCKTCWAEFVAAGSPDRLQHIACAYCVPCVRRHGLRPTCPRGHAMQEVDNEWWLKLGDWQALQQPAVLLVLQYSAPPPLGCPGSLHGGPQQQQQYAPPPPGCPGSLHGGPQQQQQYAPPPPGCPGSLHGGPQQQPQYAPPPPGCPGSLHGGPQQPQYAPPPPGCPGSLHGGPQQQPQYAPPPPPPGCPGSLHGGPQQQPQYAPPPPGCPGSLHGGPQQQPQYAPPPPPPGCPGWLHGGPQQQPQYAPPPPGYPAAGLQHSHSAPPYSPPPPGHPDTQQFQQQMQQNYSAYSDDRQAKAKKEGKLKRMWDGLVRIAEGPAVENVASALSMLIDPTGSAATGIAALRGYNSSST